MKPLRLAGLLVGIVLCAAAGAQPADPPAHDVPAQRARLARERALAETRYAQEAKACRSKFAVNDCLRQAQAERRTVVADLRRQEVILNEAERKRETAERRRALDERAAQKEKDDEEHRRQAQENAAREAHGPQGQARAPGQARGAPAPQGKPRTASPQLPQPASPEETARKARESEEKLREAQAHKASVLERAGRRKDDRAKPLPVPP